jgi:hypothetical protein
MEEIMLRVLELELLLVGAAHKTAVMMVVAKVVEAESNG